MARTGIGGSEPRRNELESCGAARADGCGSCVQWIRFSRLVFPCVTLPSLSSQPLSRSVFRSRFSALLWLEELHAESEAKEFSLSGAFLRRSASYLQLEVPGVSEGRPSASIGTGQGHCYTLSSAQYRNTKGTSQFNDKPLDYNTQEESISFSERVKKR